jgi:hypothetical protein
MGLIARPEESYRVWCVCDRDASGMRRLWPTRGRSATEKNDHFKLIWWGTLPS